MFDHVYGLIFTRNLKNRYQSMKVCDVIARQNVDGHFGTALNLPAGLLNTCYVCKPIIAN